MQVNLSWTPVSGALYYRIYRSLFSGGPYDLIAQSNPNQQLTPNNGSQVTSYQDGPNNLENGQTYYYVVAAVTVDGESSYGTEVVATYPGQPASPSTLTAVVK